MRKYFLICCVSAFAGAAFSSWLATSPTVETARAQERIRRVIDPGVLADAKDDLTDFLPEERTNIRVYDRTNRSVVHITTKSWSADAFLMVEPQGEGAGSGSVLDRKGHILTNFHVIDGANDVRVTLYNGETYRAGLVGRDSDNDIAVLRIDASEEYLHPIKQGESTGLRVGQKVFAIGNPFGLDRTLTVGILSSLNRKLPSRTGRDMKSIIQIDAALNRGNSGGPLLDSRGMMIGMNTAIASPSGAGENTGVGFAIPVNTIKRVVPQLIEHGRVIRPVIGISSVYETERGLVVIEVTPGGPADQAGLQGFRLVRDRERRGAFIYERTYVDRSKADLITEIDGRAVRTGDALMDVVEGKKPGDRVVLTIVRGERTVSVPVTLQLADE